MTLGELIDHAMTVLGCDADDGFKVAQEVYSPGRGDYSDDVLRYAAERLGVAQPAEGEPVQTTPLPEMTMDPAEVLRQVYLACPRCVPADDDGKVHLPKIGRAPVEEQHQIPQEFLDQLPEEVRVLLIDLDVVNGTAEIILYDEANGVDRKLPPIDLARYKSGEELHEAIGVLLRRLPRVLAADWN